jgi:hypothetical protein
MSSMRAGQMAHHLFRSCSDLAGLDRWPLKLLDLVFCGFGGIEDVVVNLLDGTGDAHSLLGSQDGTVLDKLLGLFSKLGSVDLAHLFLVLGQVQGAVEAGCQQPINLD